MGKISGLRLVESGILKESELGSLAKWAQQDAGAGQPIGAFSNSPTFEKYFKCVTVEGRRFLYLGSDQEFADFQKATIQ